MFSSVMTKLNNDLTDDELRRLNTMVKLLTKDVAENKKKRAKEILSDWTRPMIIRYSKHPPLKEYFETHPDIQERWKLVAIEKGFPDVNIKGKEPKETISLFQSYSADYYRKLFADALESRQSSDDKIPLLELACRLGSFDALRFRCSFNIGILKRPATSALNDAHANRIKLIENDLKRLQNLFGACGYIASGIILNNLGACFLIDFPLLKGSEHNEETPEESKKTALEPDIDRGMAYYHEAIKCFLCAWLLRNDADSNHLIEVMTKGKGLSSLFNKDDPVVLSSFETAIPYFRKTLSDTSYKLIMGRAEAEISEYLAEEKTPNMTPANK